VARAPAAQFLLLRVLEADLVGLLCSKAVLAQMLLEAAPLSPLVPALEPLTQVDLRRSREDLPGRLSAAP
jgi:hypothetical protein